MGYRRLRWAGLGVRDGDGRDREVLAVEPDGSPVLALYETESRPRASLRLERDGRPDLILLDKEGKVIWGPRAAAPSVPPR